VERPQGGLAPVVSLSTPGGALGAIRHAEDVAEIRRSYVKGSQVKGSHPTQKEIAAACGVSDAMVCLIVNRKACVPFRRRLPGRGTTYLPSEQVLRQEESQG
jgi:hypothetical protein